MVAYKVECHVVKAIIKPMLVLEDIERLSKSSGFMGVLFCLLVNLMISKEKAIPSPRLY
jgi:hypothetical protein